MVGAYGTPIFWGGGRRGSAMAKRCVLLSKRYYWQPIVSFIWEINWYQNEWPWLSFIGRIKVMSTIVWHFPLNRLCRKPLQIQAWFQKTINRKWPMGYQLVTWSMPSRDPKCQTRDPNTLRAQYLENSWRGYLATVANSAAGSTVYPSHSLASCLIRILRSLKINECIEYTVLSVSSHNQPTWPDYLLSLHTCLTIAICLSGSIGAY